MGFSRFRRLLTSCAIVTVAIWNITSYEDGYSANGEGNRSLLKGNGTGDVGDEVGLKELQKIKSTLTALQTKKILQNARRRASTNNDKVQSQKGLQRVKRKAQKNEMNLSTNNDERQLQLNHDFSDLRIACFGMSDTWAAVEFTGGVTTETEMNYFHAKFNHEGSYCKLLSPTADNYGFPSQGPNYASTCLQSMVQDNVYDVIVLDFPLVDALHVEQLVKRLRQRYPFAMILLLDRVLLKKVKLQDAANQRRQSPIELYGMGSFGTRRKRAWGGITTSMRVYDRTKFRDFVLDKKALKERNAEKYAKMTEEGKAKRRVAPPAEWELQYRNSQKEANEKIYRAYGTKPVAIGDETNLEDSLLEVNDWYMDDGATLNPAGHEHVANAIGDVIAERPYKVPIQNDAKVGTFGNGDACHLWFTSGDLSGVKLGGSAKLDNYVDIRYAVTVNPTKKGTATIVNPFQNYRTLYITYMVTPDPTKALCNRGRIVIPSSNIDVTLDTVGSTDYQASAHIISPRTIAVGTLSPGTHTIDIYQLQDNAPLPFRVMGLSLTDETNVPDQYEFTQNFWYKGMKIRLRGQNVVWV